MTDTAPEGWDPDEPTPLHVYEAQEATGQYDDLLDHLPKPQDYRLDRPTPAPVDDQAEQRSSWWPVDLAGLFDGTITLPEPELFPRADGQPILYRGKCHAFNGESESGKSWAALLACVETIRAGGHVLYLDFEDTAATCATRLLALGAKPDDIVARFHYASPGEPLQYRNGKVTRGHLDLTETLETAPVDLAVLDGVTEAMTLHGLSTNDNDDYATFHGLLPRRLARAGAAVVNIDHVTKDRDTRGRYAIGAQHKLAGMDGAVFVFEVTSPFGLGLHGIARVTITKDRPGQLRRHATGAKHQIAEFHLESDPATHGLLAYLERPAANAADADQGPTVPTWWMERVSRALEDDGPLSTRQIDALTKPDGAKGSTEAKRDARRILQSGGFIRPERNGQTLLWHSVKPYREAGRDDTKDIEDF